jgi:hypothetical protein
VKRVVWARVEMAMQEDEEDGEELKAREKGEGKGRSSVSSFCLPLLRDRIQ